MSIIIIETDYEHKTIGVGQRMEGGKVSGRAVPANLDTKGICFLCLRDKDFVNDCIGNKSLLSNTDLFSLNGMSRFLNLNIETILLKKMDLRVSLCGECSLITKRFKPLYQSLELTKMRLIECVGKIHDLMAESQNDCDRMDEAVNRMAESDDGDSHKAGIFKISQRAVMDYLRKEMIMKCSRKMKTALPRVRVRKTKVESKPLETIIVKVEPELQLEMETVSALLPASPTHTKEPSPAPEMFTAATVNSTVCPETKLNQASRTPRKSKILLRRIEENVVAVPAVAVTPFERKIKKPLIQQCPHCNGLLTSKKLLNYHKFRHHTEQDFLDFKDSSVSPDQFVKTVHHLLFQEIDDMMKSCKTCACNYCGLQFCYTKNTKMDPLKMHMIKHHHTSLVEKLTELQKDPDLNEKLELAVSASGGKTCSCGTYVASVQRMIVHQNYYCSVKNHYKVKSKTYPCWHPNCGAVFTKNCRLLKHMLKHYPYQKECQISETSETAPSNLQASSSSAVVPHASSTEAVLSSDNHEDLVKIPVEEKRTSWCCTYCNVFMSKGARLRDHMIRFHREHYFLEFRYTSVSLNEFKKLVYNLLFKDIEEQCELIIAGRPTLSCSYCDRTFVKGTTQGTVPLILHMINSHRQCLGSKLAELQSDPNLNEKLAEAVSASGGMTCSCGTYFSNKSQLGIHKNKLCRSGLVYKKVRSQILRRCFKCGKTFHPKGITGHLKKCNATFSSLKGNMNRIKLEQPALSNKAKCKECGELIWIWNTTNHRQTCLGMTLREASSSSHQSASYPEVGIGEPGGNTNMDTDSTLLRQLLTEEATSSYEHENSDYCISQSSEMQNVLRDPLED